MAASQVSCASTSRRCAALSAVQRDSSSRRSWAAVATPPGQRLRSLRRSARDMPTDYHAAGASREAALPRLAKVAASEILNRLNDRAVSESLAPDRPTIMPNVTPSTAANTRPSPPCGATAATVLASTSVASSLGSEAARASRTRRPTPRTARAQRASAPGEIGAALAGELRAADDLRARAVPALRPSSQMAVGRRHPRRNRQGHCQLDDRKTGLRSAQRSALWRRHDQVQRLFRLGGHGRLSTRRGRRPSQAARPSTAPSRWRRSGRTPPRCL